MLSHVMASLALCALCALQTAAYDIVREYSGSTFFDRWDFYGSWDNLTLGALPSKASLVYLTNSSLQVMSGGWIDRRLITKVSRISTKRETQS
jgi:hypothetical protein